MYSTLKYITILILLFNFIGCEDPAPIEITNEITTEEDVKVTIVNPEPSSYVITGYDSTGITDDVPKLSSVVAFSGIRNTFENISSYKAYAQAVFFDTTKPVLSTTNRLIGFKTFDVETVRFNNQIAEKIPYFLRFQDNFIRRDSLVGTKHSITFKRVLSPDNLDFRYNSNLKIDITSIFGNTNSLNLRIPDEIIGNVEIKGDKRSKNLTILLTWKKSLLDSHLEPGNFVEEIIIGGIRNDRDDLVPLFKLNRLRSNRFEIQNSLVEDILASNDYKYIVFTFLRKILISNSFNRLGDIHFASQSIHNIWVKL